jgi:hypothetical protein
MVLARWLVGGRWAPGLSFAGDESNQLQERLERCNALCFDPIAEGSEMPHCVALSPDRDFVILTVRGEITAAAAIEFNREQHLLGVKSGVSRYLTDLYDCRNVDTVTNNLDFALHGMADAAVDKNARVAVLVSPGDYSHDYLEGAFRCAGLDVVFFTNRLLAEEHLRAELSMPRSVEKS